MRKIRIVNVEIAIEVGDEVGDGIVYDTINESVLREKLQAGTIVDYAIGAYSDVQEVRDGYEPLWGG